MTAENETIDGGSPLPRSRGRWRTRAQKLTLLAVCCAGGLAVLILSNWLPASHTGEEKPPVRISSPGVPLKVPSETKPVPASVPAVAAKPMPMEAAPSIVNVAIPNPSKAAQAPIFASVAGGSAAPGEGDARATRAAAVNGGPRRPGQAESDGLAADLRPASIGGTAKAVRMKNPNMTIGRGTQIHCSLQTAINSQLRGFVTCITSEEVRSVSGKVTLMDRGSQIFGEVKQGLRQGQDRLMILWTSATVPVQTRSGVEYVEIALDSPAADELGRAGAPGQVNNHWWARFGSALLFSVIEAVPQIAASALQNGSNNSYTSLYSPSQQVAGTVLQETMNIPPTLEKNQGESLTVFVARNLDFSGVYDLVAAQ